MCIAMELFPSYTIKWKVGQNSILHLHKRRNEYIKYNSMLLNREYLDTCIPEGERPRTILFIWPISVLDIVASISQITSFVAKILQEYFRNVK